MPSREDAAITAAVQLHKDLDALAVRARALSLVTDLPDDLRELAEDIANQIGDTVCDCDIPAAVKRWDEAAPSRERARVDYAREQAAEMRREDLMLERPTQAAE